MKVGITVNFQFSFFSGGGSSTTIATAELCKKLGYDVYLVNVNGTQDWWDDCRGLKTDYPNILHLETLTKQTENKDDVQLDILLEVTSLITSAELRKKIAKQCVWVIRKPILLNDIEKAMLEIIKDVKIDSNDIPYLITIIQKLYEFMFSLKIGKISSEKLAAICAEIIKFIVNVLIKERRIKVEPSKQDEFLRHFNALMDSCISLLSLQSELLSNGFCSCFFSKK